jgi:hypothetical protein
MARKLMAARDGDTRTVLLYIGGNDDDENRFSLFLNHKVCQKTIIHSAQN